MSQIPKEEAAVSAEDRNETVRGGAFDTETESNTPFGFGKGEGFDKGADEKEWVVTRERPAFDEQFSQLQPVDGKISGISILNVFFIYSINFRANS